MRLLSKLQLVCVALLAAPGLAPADPLQNGVAFLTANQGLSGGFGELQGEEVDVATHEALLALRAVGMGNTASARNAGLFLANNVAPIDSEVQLRRQLALFSTAFALQQSSLVTEGPGFEQQDALHLAYTLKV